MSTPKHRTAPGISYFVTTKCWQSHAVFQVAQDAEILIEALFHYREKGAYLLHDFVIMPDHLHLMLTPSATTSLEKAMQFIKGGSSYQIRKTSKNKMQIWQVGFHDWTVRDVNDWQAKVEYIRDNPVRSKLVEKSRDWPYSSASGRFNLDPMPEKFLPLSSGAKAQATSAQTLGLKPQPPKENSHITNTPSQAKAARL
jgi:putative transposase